MLFTPKRFLQLIFGATLIAFCLMPLFGWEPPPVRDEARPMQEAIASSGYIIPLILIVYLLVGLSWVFQRYVALSAVVLFPISLNIVLFHSVLSRSAFGLVVAWALLAVNIYMLFLSRSAYERLLDRRS